MPAGLGDKLLPRIGDQEEDEVILNSIPDNVLVESQPLPVYRQGYQGTYLK
jgi:hypothetical protein